MADLPVRTLPVSDSPQRCPDCAVEPGTGHEDGCDVRRCMLTGEQHMQCGGELHEYNGRWYGEHEGSCGEDIWTGEWPGAAECREFGWWSVFKPGGYPAWSRVPPGTPGATPDLSRLAEEARWDTDLQRWVKPA